MGSISPAQYLQMLTRTEGNRLREGPSHHTPAEKEIAEIHEPILAWARSFIPFVPVIYHRPDKKSGLFKGTHDLTIFYKGHAICGEGKTRTGKRSTDQLGWALAMERQGFKVAVWRSPEEFFDIIRQIDASISPLDNKGS